MPRIVTLLPSATEIVCALGGRESLVGISHECDYPADVAGLPVLTRAKEFAGVTSRGIDRSVRELVADALGVYDLDVDAFTELDPDVVITQDLCDVCAVAYPAVESAVRSITRRDVRIVNLHPTRLEDVLGDVRRVGDAIGREEAAGPLLVSLRARIEAVRARAATIAARPTVATIEWLDPVMPGGTWMPELIAIAGGRPLFTTPGEKAGPLSRKRLEAEAPDVVVVKPCGFALDRTLAELDALRDVLPWDRWPASRAGRVYLADGNAYFNRPGPRMVDSLEILAACIHPAAFAEHRARYRDSFVRVDSDLRIRKDSA